MTQPRSTRLDLRLILVGFAVAAFLALAMQPTKAMATEPTHYCGGTTLGGGKSCIGAERTFFALEGWGANHAVCVSFIEFGLESISKCSTGPGAVVYWNVGLRYAAPVIRNAGGTNNLVNGVAWKP